MAIEATCPVCKKQTSSQFCEHCGFEIHNLPMSISPLIMTYEQRRAEKYSEMYHRNDNIDDIKAELSRKQQEIDNLNFQNKKLQEEIDSLNQASNSSSSEKPTAFLVMIQGDNVSAILNVYDGDNSYGYLNTEGRHQQIICNANVADIHFAIKSLTTTDSRGRDRTKFFVEPKGGKIFSSAGQSNIISSNRELEKNEQFFIEEVRFTIVANKNN